MATVIDVSGKLGEYMLKGWVLTDKICKTCSKVPLMRSPSGPVVFFCANCDQGPAESRPTPGSSRQPAPPAIVTDTINTQSSPSVTSSSHNTRSSTPPTEVSSGLSSPTFAPPVDTEEVIRRRQQSDTASAEIGKRLLKGWAMLADECPNLRCYGVPLVRPPKSGGERDPRKECVVCGTVYADETDSSGWTRLVPLNSVNTPGRRSEQHQDNVSNATAGPTISQSFGGKENPIAVFETDLASVSQPTSMPLSYPPTVGSSTLDVLSASAASLEHSLRSLSERLNVLSSGIAVDPSSISQTADAISKVTQALSQVKQLQWNEGQAFFS